MCVRQPGGIARLTAFEAQHVDEDRRGPTEEDVIRCTVFETEAVGEQSLCQIEGEQTGRMQHLRVPFVRKAGKSDALVLQDHLPVPCLVERPHGGVGQQFAAFGGFQGTGGDDGARGHQFLPGWGREEGFQIGRTDGVDDAQNPALVVKQATGWIAE